jgi:hypothetical protein
LTHVDDFLHAGSAQFEVDVISRVLAKYKISRQQDSKFKYVGFGLDQDKNGITVDQCTYVDNIRIEPLPAERKLQKVSELTRVEYKLFRSYVGKINWVTQGTRPDVNFDMIELSTKFQCANVSHLMDAIKTLSHIKSGTCKVRMPKLYNSGNLRLVVYTDASFANLSGHGSCAGFAVFLVDSGGNSCVIAWHSGKVKRIVKSTLSAECLSLTDGLDMTIYLREILKFCIGKKLAIHAVIDNLSLLEAIKSTKQVAEKRLCIDIASIKEAIATETVTVHWVKGEHQLADCLTKRGASGDNLLKCVQTGRLPDIQKIFETK